MRIQKIKIRNFRGFAEKEVEFNGMLSVIIGDNTAGKTTLLKALQVGLGAYLQSLSIIPGGKPYRCNFSRKDRYKPFDPEKRNYIPNPENPRIEIIADCSLNRLYNGYMEESVRTINWAREFVNESYTAHTKPLAWQIMDYADELCRYRTESHSNVVLPLVLSFGAQRTDDAQAKKTVKVNERMTREERAYMMALHEKVDFKGAREWLRRYDKNIKVGIMTETAAAGIIADLLAKESDFFSIGTNDLTGYTMAADRGNSDVSYLYSALQPGVLRMIRSIITAARENNIPVGMCGEAAADPLMIPLLISFGLTEFSVSAPSVLRVRKCISGWTKEKADEVAEKVMSLSTEAEVREYLCSVTG